MGVNLGGKHWLFSSKEKCMKNKPRKEDMPSRSQCRFNEKTQEWEVRIKFRYVDGTGQKHDSSSGWKSTFEECKQQMNELLEANKKTINAQSNQSVKQALEDCVQYYKSTSERTITSKYVNDLIKREKSGLPLSREEKRTIKIFKDGTPFKNTDSGKYDALSALNKHFFPKQIVGNVKVKEMLPSHWSRWIAWIDSINAEHTFIGGKSVRKYRNALHNFNHWLFAQGYYGQDENVSLQTKLTTDAILTAVEIRDVNSGKRTDRAFPKYEDLTRIGQYYKDKGLGDFKNFYFYCVWYLLFFSAMRAGELVALQWQWIDFEADNGDGVIHIYDAINESDSYEDNMKRINALNFSTKRPESKRDITMWNCYRQMMRDYKQCYKYHFNVDEEQMKTMFVFPNITAREIGNRTRYQRHDNLREEIIRVCKDLNISPDYDVQMFRHATARFLCYDKHLKPEDCKRYFGHSKDSDYITETYLEYEKENDRKELNRSLEDMIHDKKISPEEKTQDFVDRLNPNNINKIVNKSKMNREWAQIKKAIQKGQKEYHYLPEYQYLIDEFPKHRPDLVDKIKFIKDEK